MKLETTFNLLRHHNACESGYRTLAKALGGLYFYGSMTPIRLAKIIETNSLNDALWCLRAVLPEQLPTARRVIVEFACRVAERVLPIYEEKYPGDTRPRDAINAARAFAELKISLQDLQEAKGKAWQAYRAAAAAAAAYADAYAAAAAAAYADAAAAAYADAYAAADAAAYAADAADAYAAADAAAYARRSAERAVQTEIFRELLAYYEVMPIKEAA